MKFEEYLKIKIRENIKEGYPKKQAVAIAYKQTDKHFDYPRIVMLHAGELVVPKKYVRSVDKFLKTKNITLK